MKTMLTVVLTLAALALITLPAQAQSLSLRERASIELNAGMWSGWKASTVVTATGVQTEAKIVSFVGGLLFSYWVQEYLSVTLSGGILEGRVSSTATVGSASQRVSSVVSVLVGVRYYALGSDAGGTVRPFLAAAVGPYIGSEVKNTIFVQESRTETAFGGRVGAGVDFIIGNHFKLGANAGYHLMTDFGSPVGSRANYNGGEFSLGVGYVF